MNKHQICTSMYSSMIEYFEKGELSCTYRNSKDIAFAISEVYDKVYMSNPFVHSLRAERFPGAQILGKQDRTLYLVFTQEEKKVLIGQGYGTGEESSVMTFHEAQGHTSEEIIVIQTKSKRLKIHNNVSHMVVAVSRHTKNCAYYSDDKDDGIGRFVGRALDTTTKEILEYTLKMAISHRDTIVIEDMLV
ncbi:unnamed protein product [Euphydryas editha]|uniref:(+)RNA virus helicase C-terminal domain-containing protein n=1 Tax=Euphydryas editha TaxID=104508 RepID=A0AAU9TX22_EUPED|nr:unnamed protein product [Euphydryas editha]